MTNANSGKDIVTHFNYEVLEPTQRALVRQHTGEIQDRLRRTAQDIWEIGKRLASVRDHLQYGQFDVWLKAEFGWSRRTAYNFINVYESFGEQATLEELDIATSALYLLAAPSTPPTVRQEYLEKAQSGKKLTHKDLRQALREKKVKKTDAQKNQPISKDSKTSTSSHAAAKPEIVAVIPHKKTQQQDTKPQPHASEAAVGNVLIETTLASQVTPVPQPSIQIKAIQSGWYLLGDRHFIFCGDTASPEFYNMIPDAAFALAATADDWDHDWLVDAATTVLILPEAMLQGQSLEQTIKLYSKPNDAIIFPWLPNAEMLAVAHRLNRQVFAGDQRPEYCKRAIAASGLTVGSVQR
ncbi:MAG: DUF3102 domain-containing protein [Cyanobacteria bacterium P01_F01_bin.150]